MDTENITAFDNMVYDGDDDFMFVSYCHADVSIVESFFRPLYYNGLRFWYDRGGAAIGAGDRWQRKIDEKINRCTVFVAFLSNVAAERDEVKREISLALNREPRPDMYFIMVERTLLTHFPKNIRDVIRTRQFIPLYKNGVTGMTVEWFFGSLKNTKIIDDAFRLKHGQPKWSERVKYSETDSLPSFKDMERASVYIYDRVVPEMNDKGEFFMLSPGDTAPQTVYSLCFDNTWIPEKLLQSDCFEDGGGLAVVRDEIIPVQKREVCKALLHNLQIVVNRAHIYNSSVFVNFYAGKTESDPECAAFYELLKSGAIVVALTTEKTLTEKPKYDVLAFDDWVDICNRIPMFFLKFDWKSSENNKHLVNEKLAARFQNFCLTTGSDENSLDALERCLNIPEERRGRFEEVWRDIHDAVISQYREKERQDKREFYTRNSFYAGFIVKPGENNVVRFDVDTNKPFWRELKKIVDYRYFLNFVEAFEIRPLLPSDCEFKNFAFPGDMRSLNYRVISIDELVFAAVNFIPWFYPSFSSGKVCLPASDAELSLDTVLRFRNVAKKNGAEKPWLNYIRAIDNARKRADRQELDLFDAYYIFNAFKNWMKYISELGPELEWKETVPCITVIYRIGNASIRILYKNNKAEVFGDYPESNGDIKHKTIITADVICGDFRETNETSYFLTEVRLFTAYIAEFDKKIFDDIVSGIERYTKGA